MSKRSDEDFQKFMHILGEINLEHVKHFLETEFTKEETNPGFPVQPEHANRTHHGGMLIS